MSLETSPIPFDFKQCFKPWSYSKLSKLNQCPFLFFTSEIDKHLYPRDKINLNAVQGISLHKFFEEVFKGTITIDDLFMFVQKEKIPEWHKNNILKKYQGIKKLHSEIHKTVKKILKNNIRLQPEFRVDLDDNFVKVDASVVPMYKGIMDIVAKNDTEIVLIDHKSSADRLSDFEEQMKFYNLLLISRFPSIQRIHTYINDLKELELKHMFTQESSHILEVDKEWFLTRFNSMIEKYPTKDRSLFYPVKTAKCKWCLIPNLCKEFDKKLIIKSA